MSDKQLSKYAPNPSVSPQPRREPTAGQCGRRFPADFRTNRSWNYRAGQRDPDAFEYYSLDGCCTEDRSSPTRNPPQTSGRYSGRSKPGNFGAERDPRQIRQARDTLNNTYGFHCRPKATFRTLQLSAHSCDRATDNQSIPESGHPAQRKNPAGGHYDPQAPGTQPPPFLPRPGCSGSWAGSWAGHGPP